MGVLKGWSQASRQGRGEPPGTGRGCMHTLPWCGGRAACTRTVPRPSIPTQNTPREVTQWTYSAALLKRLLCSTARVNHSHTQPPPHHSPEINPTCTIPILLPGSRLITPTPPLLSHNSCSVTHTPTSHKAHPDTPLCEIRSVTKGHQHSFTLLPAAWSASQAILTDTSHPTRDLMVAPSPPT